MRKDINTIREKRDQLEKELGDLSKPLIDALNKFSLETGVEVRSIKFERDQIKYVHWGRKIISVTTRVDTEQLR